MKKRYFKTGIINRLSNDSFPHLVLQLISVMDEYPCDNSLIQEAFDRLRDHTPTLNTMTNNYNYHPFTDEINILVANRLRCFSIIKTSANTMCFSPQSNVSVWAQTVCNWLRPYNNKWRRPLIDPQTRYTFNLKTTLDDSAATAEALTKLGLMSEFETMVRLNIEIDEKFSTRSNEVALNRRNIQEVREEIKNDLLNALILIECTDRMNTSSDENLQILIDRLREMINNYHRRYKIRETIRRKASQKNALSIDTAATQSEPAEDEDKTVV